MSEGYISLIANDLEALSQYYQTQLQAECVDQTDTTVLLLLGSTLFELVLGKGGPGCLSIAWEDYGDFVHWADEHNLKIKTVNNHHKTGLTDPEGNLVTFSYYEMSISKDVFIEKIMG